MSKGRVYIGTSGWIYPHWGGGVCRFITHMKKLKDLASSTRNFLTNASDLREKIGPVSTSALLESKSKAVNDAYGWAVKNAKTLKEMLRNEGV